MARLTLLRGALRASPFLASVTLAGWSLATNPFTHPFVEAAPAQVERALERAMARQVTPPWLAAELDEALAAKDLDRVETLVLIGTDQGLVPSPEQEARIETLREEQTGWLAQAQTCGVCMADIATCPSLRTMAMCGVPFELTPLGDANALRRAGVAAWNGEEIDTLDASLAVVGLGATATVVVSGGSSLTVKAGAGVLRIARRTGRLTERFAGMLGDLTRGAIRTERLQPYLRGDAVMDEVVDSARLARLSEVSTDLARVVSNTSVTDTIYLMKNVDTAEDAARLARVSDVTGPKTRAVFDTLGKRRAFRALVRLSDLALAAGALLYLAVLQILLTLAGWLGLRAWRVVVRRV